MSRSRPCQSATSNRKSRLMMCSSHRTVLINFIYSPNSIRRTISRWTVRIAQQAPIICWLLRSRILVPNRAYWLVLSTRKASHISSSRVVWAGICRRRWIKLLGPIETTRRSTIWRGNSTKRSALRLSQKSILWTKRVVIMMKRLKRAMSRFTFQHSQRKVRLRVWPILRWEQPPPAFSTIRHCRKCPAWRPRRTTQNKR
jgi:hypothetical protein